MRIVICGAGRVGQGIARRLSAEGHAIQIIDEDAKLIDLVTSEIDVKGIKGHAAHPEVLRAAGVQDCEMIIAVTYYDEINMVICQIAHSLFSVPTKIARIRAQAYLSKGAGDLFSRDHLPIDMVISPEIAVGEAILERFRTPGALLNVGFAKGQVKLLGLEVAKDSPLIDTAIDQMSGLFPGLDARISGIGRGKTIFAPRSNDRLMAGDRAYCAVHHEHADRLISIFDNDAERKMRHVVLIGAGNIGRYVARHLEKETAMRVRLIEQGREQAERAVMDLNRTIVIEGDGLNPRILEEAGVSRADFVITLTDDDKANLLISNLAKRSGARRTLALINSADLNALARDMGVDVVLDPRALTVSQILLRLRKGRILALHSLEEGQAEVAEGVALETSQLVGEAVDYDDLPEGITAAAVVRDGEVFFPSPELRIKPKDHIVLFYEHGQTNKVERFLRVSPDFF